MRQSLTQASLVSGYCEEERLLQAGFHLKWQFCNVPFRLSVSQGTLGDVAGSRKTLGDVAGSQGTLGNVAGFQGTLGDVAGS